MATPIRLRAEHHNGDVLGIGISQPRISWSFSGYPSGWRQSSYDLEVVWAKDGYTQVHTETTSQNLFVPWPFRPLRSLEGVQIRVRVTDQHGAISSWSAGMKLETGLLHSEDWRGCSLLEPSTAEDVSRSTHRPIVFRRVVELSQPVGYARICITAHGVYDIKINGQTLQDHVLAPGWTSYHHRLLYQTLDVTSFFQDSTVTKVIEITVAEGWFAGRLGFCGGRQNIYGETLGLIAKLVFKDVSGQESWLGTDNSWTWSYGPILSSGLYDGETVDLRLQPSETNPVVCLPLADTLQSQGSPPVRRIEEISVKQVLRTPLGKTILDFGQNFVGRVRARLRGPAGQTIIFRYAEVLENGELGTRPLRHAKAVDRVTLASEDATEWEPSFTFHGFRYVEVEGWSEDLDPADITGVVLHTDMQRTGHFTCSNPMLNKLHENVVWSMRSNFLSIPTDCPQRDERLGWTGDINAFADTANFLFDTFGMLSSWLEDLSAEQADADGVVPLTIPNVVLGLEKEPHAIWGDVAVMLPWSLYLAFGDPEILSRQYASMQSWLGAIPRRKGGLLWDYTSEWKLGDWLDPFSPSDDPGNALTDPTFVSDAFLVHVYDTMYEISVTLELESESARYREMARTVRAAFQTEYVTPAGRLVPDTQTAYALAIQFSLLETPPHLQTAAARLTELIRRNSRFSIATGFAGTAFMGHALSKLGLNNLFYRMLLHRKCPSWLYPITMGATTIWERWDSMLPDGSINPGEMTSFNHYALGAVAGWMHNRILGLRMVEPGWKVFSVAIVPGGGLQWAQGEYLSPYGLIRVYWEITTAEEKGGHDHFAMKLQVPPNTKARVHLPGSLELEERGSGEHAWDIPYAPNEVWPPRALYPPSLTPDDQLALDEVLPPPAHGFRL